MLDRVFVCRYTAKSVLGNVWRFVGMGDDLERLYDLAQLYDLYGALLTGKQRECLHLHIAEDFSLAEIGETLGITRQAAHESIRRAEHALAEMEERLGLRARRAAGVGRAKVAGSTGCSSSSGISAMLSSSAPLSGRKRSQSGRDSDCTTHSRPRARTRLPG